MQFGGFQSGGFGFNTRNTPQIPVQVAPPSWQGSFTGFKPTQSQPNNTGFGNVPTIPPSMGISRGFITPQQTQHKRPTPKPFNKPTERRPSNQPRTTPDVPRGFGGFAPTANTMNPQPGFGAIRSESDSGGFKAISQVARSNPNSGFAVPKPIGFQNVQQTPIAGFSRTANTGGFNREPVVSRSEEYADEHISRGSMRRPRGRAVLSRGRGKPIPEQQSFKPEHTTVNQRGFHTRASHGFVPRGGPREREPRRTVRGSHLTAREQDFRQKALESIRKPQQKEWEDIENEESVEESPEDVDLDQSDHDSAELSDGKIANEEDFTSDEDIDESTEQTQQESDEEPSIRTYESPNLVSSRLQRFAKSTESASRGSITEMCSSAEALRREESYTLNLFEIAPNTDLSSNHKPSVYLPWTIKEYLRSAPETKDTARNPEALSSTLDYLLNNILDVDMNGNPLHYTLPAGESVHKFSNIYAFISNRVRAIAKDYKILGNTTTDSYVNDHERMARFLILSSVEGIGQEDFNSKLNADRIKDILVTCLHHSYRERKDLGLINLNEAEFIGYSILYNLISPIEVQMWIRDISPDLYNSPYIKYAISAFISFNTNNFVKYFEIAKEAPYLISCLMYLHFDQIRTEALSTLKKAVRDIDLEYLVKILWFTDKEEALEYLYDRGVLIKQHDDDTWEVNLHNSQLQFTTFKPTKAPENILQKRSQHATFRKQLIEGEMNLSPIQPKAAPTNIPKKVVPSRPALTSSDYFDTLVGEYIKELTIESSYEEVFSIITRSILEDVIKDYRPSPPKVQVADSVIPTLPTAVQYTPIVQKVKEAINKWVFPDTEDKLEQIIQDKSEKETFQTTIKNYKNIKKQQKAQANHKSKLAKLRFLFLYFKSWKQYLLYQKFKKYSKDRMTQELSKFRSQFSKARDWELQKQQIVGQLYRGWGVLEKTPEITEKDLLRLKEENSRLYYKFSLISVSNNMLIEKSHKYFESKLSVLHSNNFYVNYSENHLKGSDLVLLILNQEEIDFYDFRSLPYSHIHLIVIGSDIDKLALENKLRLTNCREFQVIFTTQDEMDRSTIYDNRLYNFILYPLTQSLQEDPNPIWEQLQIQSTHFLDVMFEETFSKADVSTKEIMMDSRYSSVHTWIERVNSLVSNLESTYFSLFYTQEPPPEALQEIFKIEVSSYESAKTHYESIRSLVQSLGFRPMPQDPAITYKHLQGCLYAYAAESIAIYELCLPGYGHRLLKSLDEIFANDPVRCKPELTVPWAQYFVTILSLKLECIHELAGDWIWDTTKSYIDHLHYDESDSVSFSDYNIYISETQPFNDILSKAIFETILAEKKKEIEANPIERQSISTPQKPVNAYSGKLFPHLIQQYAKPRNTPIKRARISTSEDSGPYKIPKSVHAPKFRLNFVSSRDEMDEDPVWRLIEESKRVRQEAIHLLYK